MKLNILKMGRVPQFFARFQLLTPKLIVTAGRAKCDITYLSYSQVICIHSNDTGNGFYLVLIMNKDCRLLYQLIIQISVIMMFISLHCIARMKQIEMNSITSVSSPVLRRLQHFIGMQCDQQSLLLVCERLSVNTLIIIYGLIWKNGRIQTHEPGK